MFNNTIPKAMVSHIDQLYQSMASIDYRKREKDLQSIFRRINICEKIARNLKAYERWKVKKQKQKGDL
jgi:hypothetical protein